MIAYTILDRNTASIFLNGNMLTITRAGHTAFDKLLVALEQNDEKSVSSLVSTREYFVKYLRSMKLELSFDGGNIYYGDEKLFGPLVDKIIRFQNEGLPVSSLTLFLENLMANPSKKSREQFYTFLEKYHFAITPDGHFLAYKGVTEAYTSVHSGPGLVNGKAEVGYLSNAVGNIVEIEREKVDPDSDKHCSTGLHVGHLRYAQSFAHTTVVVKVNPRDVVSVPTDSNAEKVRVCRYEVVAEFKSEITDDYTPLFAAPEVITPAVKSKKVLDSGNTKTDSFKARLQNLSNKYSRKGKVADNIFTLMNKLEEVNNSINILKFIEKLDELYPSRYTGQPVYNYHLKAVLESM